MPSTSVYQAGVSCAGSSPGALGGRSMFGNTTRARRRVVATIPVLALAAAGLATMGATSASAAPSHVSAPVISDDEYYMNYVAPRAEGAFGTDDELVDIRSGRRVGRRAVERRKAVDEKFSQGNPLAAKGLATLEARRSRPARAQALKAAKGTQEAKLLTILVEFSENANDDFSGVRCRRVRLDGVQAGRGAERAAAQQHPEPRGLRARGQQLDVGLRLLVGALQHDALHRRGHHRARAPRPARSRRQARHRHLGLHDEEHVRGDVARRLHRARLGDPVGHGAALRGVLRREHLLPERGRRLRGRRDPGHAGPPRQPARRRPAPDRRRDGARGGAARLPVGRLRHRGPGRP